MEEEVGGRAWAGDAGGGWWWGRRWGSGEEGEWGRRLVRGWGVMEEERAGDGGGGVWTGGGG